MADQDDNADPFGALRDDPGLRAILESSIYGDNGTDAGSVETKGGVRAAADRSQEGQPLPPREDLATVVDALAARPPGGPIAVVAPAGLDAPGYPLTDVSQIPPDEILSYLTENPERVLAHAIVHPVDPGRVVEAAHVRVEPEAGGALRRLVAARALEDAGAVVDHMRCRVDGGVGPIDELAVHPDFAVTGEGHMGRA